MSRKIPLLLMVLCLTSPARADIANLVWFETDNSNGNLPNASAPAGGPGSALVLNCDNNAQQCRWTIRMMMSIGSAGLYGWKTDLVDTPNSNFPLSATNGVVGANNPFTGFGSFQHFGTGGSGPALLTGAQGQQISGPAFGLIHLLTFDLIKSPGTPPATGTMNIFARVSDVAGPIEWADGNGEYPFVAFGSNSPIVGDGAPQHQPPNAVIQVNIRIPEPMTGLLLALGTWVITRRRHIRRGGARA